MVRKTDRSLRKEAEGPRTRLGHKRMGEQRRYSYWRLSGGRGAWTLPAFRCGNRAWQSWFWRCPMSFPLLVWEDTLAEQRPETEHQGPIPWQDRQKRRRRRKEQPAGELAQQHPQRDTHW